MELGRTEEEWHGPKVTKDATCLTPEWREPETVPAQTSPSLLSLVPPSARSYVYVHRGEYACVYILKSISVRTMKFKKWFFIKLSMEYILIFVEFVDINVFF